MLQQLHNISLGLKCPSCNIPLGELDRKKFLSYLNKINPSCEQCKNEYNFFSVISRCINENFFMNDVFYFVGAKKSFFETTLSPTKPTTLKFSDFDIPKGSRVLHINYTPQNQGLFPLEFHGNSPYRGAPRDSVVLYPAKFEENAKTTKLNIMITWIDDKSLEDASLKSLVDALEEYSRDEYTTSIVPANTSIEFDVIRYAEEALENISSKKNVKEFFKSGIGYVPTLKILIPLISQTKNFPPMPQNMLDSLVQLASFRNQIAHTGKTKTPLTKEIVASNLAAVVLGKLYIHELRKANIEQTKNVDA